MMQAAHVNPPDLSLSTQLLAAKPALPDESLASWAQRVCGDHQYTMPMLIRIIGYEPRLRDWDLPIPHAIWEQTKLLLPLGPEHDHPSLSTLGALCSHIHPAQLLWHERRIPRYRWCRECFNRDGVPYLRWFWRLSALTWCPIHSRLLSEVCPTCGVPLLMHTSRLVASGRHGQASTLAHCDNCGMPLRDPKPRWTVAKDETTVPLEILLSRLGELHRFVDVAAAHRARSYLAPMLPAVPKEEKRNAPRLALSKATDTPFYRTPEGLTAREVKKRLFYEKAWLRSVQCSERLLATLGHNAALSKNYNVYKKKAKKVQWSWNLDANARVAMAGLLRITRWEKLAAREDKEQV